MVWIRCQKYRNERNHFSSILIPTLHSLALQTILVMIKHSSNYLILTQSAADFSVVIAVQFFRQLLFLKLVLTGRDLLIAQFFLHQKKIKRLHEMVKFDLQNYPNP